MVGLIDKYKFALDILKRILKDEELNEFCKFHGLTAEYILKNFLEFQKNYDENDWTAIRNSLYKL